MIVRTLPSGIGLVQVKTPLWSARLVSDRLTQKEAEAARAIGAFLLRRTTVHAVILSISEIAEAVAA